MRRPVQALQILGTGIYLPERVVASVELDRRWQKAEGWTERLSGVRSRRIASKHETTSMMGAAAAQMALANAQLDARQLDCIVSACSVMEQAIPCSAVLIQRSLGLGAARTPAFDVNATCLSFLVALDLVACAVAAGRYERVLIVSSEIPSCGIDDEDHETAALFGDGAAAAVVSRGEDPNTGIVAALFETYSDGAELCQVRAGGTRLRPADDERQWHEGTKFEMQGRATYRMAAQRLPGFLDRLLTRAELTTDDLQVIVPHQASGKALSHLQEALGLAPHTLIRVLPTHGNQIAASIPSALHTGIASGDIARGHTVALVGSGAGLSFGGVVLNY
jgi:3-oxoacyl-[acyl-carrier-protein] synthase III